MVQDARPTNEPDMALIHHFIRLFGRVPSPGDLSAYQRARAGLALRRPGRRLRRRAARLIVRL